MSEFNQDYQSIEERPFEEILVEESSIEERPIVNPLKYHIKK